MSIIRHWFVAAPLIHSCFAAFELEQQREPVDLAVVAVDPALEAVAVADADADADAGAGAGADAVEHLGLHYLVCLVFVAGFALAGRWSLGLAEVDSSGH